MKSQSRKQISIIIPCHNTASTLEACWHSIKTQSHGLDALECIFVDDASDDNNETWNTLLTIEREAPEHVITIQLPENMRQGGARNAGLQYASGRYLQFLDADDELLPDACNHLFRMAEETGCDIIQFNHYVESSSGRRVERNSRETKLYTISTPPERKPFLVGEHVSYGCWNKFYRMEVIRRSGARFAEHLIYEEPLFVYPQFFFAQRIYLIEDCLYLNHLHPGQTMASLAAKRLTDHPQVQLQVLEYCLARQELMLDYASEIEFYFLWSFYLETVLLAERAQVSLSEKLIASMRDNCNRLFPDWRNNPYILELNPDYRCIMDQLGSI